LFTFGGALGALLGGGAAALFPAMGMDPRTAALVGMAAIFAGASQALLASVVFAFETTLQPFSLLPLLAGCTMAYLIARLLMEHSIMTEKIARRGLRVSGEYSADMLARVPVREAMSVEVVCLRAKQTVGETRQWMANEPGGAHTGFPIVDDGGRIVGVITRRDVAGGGVEATATLGACLNREPVTITDSASVREAIDLMVAKGVGRLPVVKSESPSRVVGILTRSDILKIYGQRQRRSRTVERVIAVESLLPGGAEPRQRT
jgi:CBS domain-containing protein